MTLPSFEQYPDLASLPRVELCDLPTPVECAGGILPLPGGVESKRATCSLWVKRDDLTSTVYGGNKVRKLEFLLGQALAEQRRAIITFGAYGSNHALATAVHASALGLETHVVLSPQAPGPFAAATLRAHAALGTHLHPVDGWDGRREAVTVKRTLTERDAIEPLVIPMGGTNATGAVGYVNAAFEVAGQVRERTPGEPTVASGDCAVPDVVYVAAGTLGTAVGLAVGFAALDRTGTLNAPRVVAVRVTPGEVANEALAERLIVETVALLRSHDPRFPAIGPDDVRLDLRHDFFEPGYGVPTPESLDAVRLAGEAGIALETTYTGKALAALIADAHAGGLAETAGNALFWDTYHSGPLPPPGPVGLLPPVLQEYVAECEREFGGGEVSAPGD